VENILSMQSITKIYDNGVAANSDMDFFLRKGEIHALVGENGAGKTTLMRILFGMEMPSRGSITLYGKQLEHYDSHKAISYGIGMVHQHFMLVNSFTVAQNIMLGIEPQKWFFVDKTKMDKTARELSQKYNLVIDPKAITGGLSVGIKQKIEILKTLARGAKIIILDEPTAVLTPQETDLLFKELQHLRNMDYSIIFITHKIPEVKQISDRITVMRKGKNAGTFETTAVSEKEISTAIMGVEMSIEIPYTKPNPGNVGIEVKDLTYYGNREKPILKDINFQVRYGTILGIVGVQGNGQVELVKLLTKELTIETGEIKINSKSISNKTVGQMRDAGYTYIPEDRMHQGVAMHASIVDNILANRYKKVAFSRFGCIDRKSAVQAAKDCITIFDVNAVNENQPVMMLSGGNIQKVVVARECSVSPRVMIAEQPSRGIDIGAAYIVHKNLIALRNANCAVLVISADLDEALQVCDAILVMYDGEIVAYFDDPTELTKEKLGLYMLGIERHDKEQMKRRFS
jgi:simple sugar transport system ATP-binding protein